MSKRSVKRRKDIKMEKYLDKQLEALSMEVRNFTGYLYHNDINSYFENNDKSLQEKIHIYRLLLIFGFMYDKQINKWKTEESDLPDNEMMKELKTYINIEDLIFNYKKKSY